MIMRRKKPERNENERKYENNEIMKRENEMIMSKKKKENDNERYWEK